jgi:nucleotidyltransferase AbiEii toxin of type IV toxin-antitoxin system
MALRAAWSGAWRRSGTTGNLASSRAMTRLEAALAMLLRDLARQRIDVALVGGLAVSARAEPRLTRDVDLAVAVTGDDQAEQLVQALLTAGYATVAVVEHETTRRLATVRVSLPGESARGVVGDLLFASSGIEPIVVAEAEPLEVFSGLVVPVARIGHLIALKLLSRDDDTRPQDVVDLRALFQVVTEPELVRAREAVRRIEEGGFARGRDLGTALANWLRDRPPSS